MHFSIAAAEIYAKNTDLESSVLCYSDLSHRVVDKKTGSVPRHEKARVGFLF